MRKLRSVKSIEKDIKTLQSSRESAKAWRKSIKPPYSAQGVSKKDQVLLDRAEGFLAETKNTMRNLRAELKRAIERTGVGNVSRGGKRKSVNVKDPFRELSSPQIYRNPKLY